jgi:hypothetical protein
MTVVNFPEAPANVRTAIQVVIDSFNDYSDEATDRINAAKRLLLDYLSEADKNLFRPAIDVGDIEIGIRTEGVNEDGNVIGLHMRINIHAPEDAWFQSGVDSDTIVQFYANTTGENFIVYMRGPL